MHMYTSARRCWADRLELLSPVGICLLGSNLSDFSFEFLSEDWAKSDLVFATHINDKG